MICNLQFINACEYGQTERVVSLLENEKCNIQHTNYDRENGLMLASGASHHEIVKILIETGKYDIYLRNGRKESILMLAASRGCVDTSCSILPTAKRQGHEEGDFDPHRRENRLKAVRLIINEMVSQSQRMHSTGMLQEYFSEVLRYACREDHLSQVRALLETNLCDMGATDEYSSSFLVYARTPRIIQALTQNQKYTYSGEQIQKALWSAYRLGRSEVMAYLINHLDAHAYRPRPDPLDVFEFRERILPRIFNDLSSKNAEYAKVKDNVDELLQLSQMNQ